MGHTIGVHFYVLCEELGPNLNPSTTTSPPHSLITTPNLFHIGGILHSPFSVIISPIAIN